jgi:mRNA-degrading endonuclease RelE of RelBE toxin-antitoxin system
MSKPLRYELEGLRSARRGDYRVLFSLDPESRTLLVVRVAHRADAYR